MHYTSELSDMDNGNNIISIFLTLSSLFKIRLARTGLRKDCFELNEKIIVHEKNKLIKEENINKIDEILMEYENIEKEAKAFYYYCMEFFCRLESNYDNNSKKVNAKDISNGHINVSI